MVLFIPWRVVAEESGAVPVNQVCCPYARARGWPHDGEVAGGAGAISF
jgi:hypothetical protein